jgi:hypothetical protein
MEPLLEYIDQVDAAQPDDFVTIVLPSSCLPAGGITSSTTSGRSSLAALLFRPNGRDEVPFHLNR